MSPYGRGAVQTLPLLTETAVTNFQVAGGAAQWVDLDLSGTVGVGVKWVWLGIFHNGAAGQTVGVRQKGSVIARQLNQDNTVDIRIREFITKTDVNGIIQAYQGAAISNYQVFAHSAGS